MQQQDESVRNLTKEEEATIRQQQQHSIFKSMLNNCCGSVFKSSMQNCENEQKKVAEVTPAPNCHQRIAATCDKNSSMKPVLCLKVGSGGGSHSLPETPMGQGPADAGIHRADPKGFYFAGGAKQ